MKIEEKVRILKNLDTKALIEKLHKYEGDLEQALKRAGYRFKPLNNYQLYRIHFSG